MGVLDAPECETNRRALHARFIFRFSLAKSRILLESGTMAMTAPPLTVEDYKVLPETGPRYQLIEGDLHMAPAPNRYHQHISRNLEFIILNWINQGNAPGAEVYDAPFDVYLDNTNVFQPDILYVAPENTGILTESGCVGPPDLIIEILSPRTRQLDVGPKKVVYARHGVKELWVIDPESKTIEVFEFAISVETPAHRYDWTDRFERPLLPGLVIDAAKVFAM
jgi:Uma2 family endonuclease